jgi:hypothetical protein
MISGGIARLGPDASRETRPRPTQSMGLSIDVSRWITKDIIEHAEVSHQQWD